MNSKFPCGICSKNVTNNHYAVYCDICKVWVHIKCNDITKYCYRKLEKSEDPWFCKNCIKDIAPFLELSQNQLEKIFIGKLVTSPKNILKENMITFTNKDLRNVTHNDLLTPEDFKKINTSPTSHLYLHMNISSLPYHFEDFEALIKNSPIKPKIIGISECRLRTDFEPLTHIDLEGYTYEFTPTDSSKGGTLIYINKDVKHKIRTDLQMEKSKEIESTFIEVLEPNPKDNQIFGCIYKHPKVSINEFKNDFLAPVLEKISTENKETVLMGDFNINLLNYNSDNDTSSFVDLMYSSSFFPTINSPTRVTTTSETLIDNIFYNNITKTIVSGNIASSISDHLTQYLIIKHEQINPVSRKQIEINSFRNYDKDIFSADLKGVDWINYLQINQNNPHHSFELFINKVDLIFNKHCPKKTISLTQKNPNKPWLTAGILKSIKVRDKLSKQFCKCKNILRKSELREKYRTYRNQIVNLKRICKEDYFKNFFMQNRINSKKVWDGIRTLINTKKRKSSNQINLNINDKTITDETQIANHFNVFFTSIATKLLKKIPPTTKTVLLFLRNSNENSFFLTPTTPKEIEDIISKLKLGKAVGPNSIPTRILKDHKKVLSKPLSDLINSSFNLGIFPDLLKLAKVIALFKKGDPQSCNNYRPISLLSNLSKIIEKLLYQRLYSFLEQHNCLFNYQFGFRNHHSTNHALISITEKIRKALDDGKYASGVFLDFQKAFDTVNHNILLSKLEHYGIRGIPLNFLKTYLQNRQQYVSINNSSSDILTIENGVPQGSVLGPLLFLIYINDLNNAVKHSDIHHFADDTNVLYVSNSLKDINNKINHDLKNIVEWLRANKISLNAGKTELVIFRSKNKRITKKLNFRISGQKIKICNKTKYLGIILDENLTFKPHLDKLKLKLNRGNCLLSKIRYYVQAGLLRTIYYALFDSHLRYGSQIWGQLNNNQDIEKIKITQNKALRIINFKGPLENADELYKNSKIFKIQDTIKIDNCLLVYDQLKGNLPQSFKNYFNHKSAQHQYNTRRNRVIVLHVKPPHMVQIR